MKTRSGEEPPSEMCPQKKGHSVEVIHCKAATFFSPHALHLVWIHLHVDCDEVITPSV